MPNPQPITQVDAFTDTRFRGNPAAVCILPNPADEGWMQNVAAEMNLSETAFLHPREDGYHLRWFTPVTEVDLCGHATLASAHVLWEEGHLAGSAEARFHTASGVLTVRRQGAWMEMNFPAEPPHPTTPPAGLLEALGVHARFVGQNRLDYLVEAESENVVRELAPDFSALGQISTRGIIVTAPGSSSDYHFVSRCFFPAVGINEDPVTGSAHCCLGPYWAGRLGRDSLVGYQASARGGTVRVRVAGDRVLLGGQAVTTLRGELLA